jgi:hypothetical protein
MPKTPEGKKRSSQNSLKHGMRAKNVLVLADESEEQYQETRRGWLKSFEPKGYHEMRLVEQLILNDWLLKRANRRLLEAEADVDAENDTENCEHRMELMQRYKTTAERSFYRALAAAEALRKDQLREELIKERLTWRYDRKIASLREKVNRLRAINAANGQAPAGGGKESAARSRSSRDSERASSFPRPADGGRDGAENRRGWHEAGDSYRDRPRR